MNLTNHRGIAFAVRPLRITLNPEIEMKTYDIASPAIQCRADETLASVFEINCGALGIVRVLHFTQAEAEALAREYAAGRLSEFTETAVTAEAAEQAGLFR